METTEKLGKYEIKRTLGKGAMGVVYEGWDPIIARRVAIKTVRIPDTHDDPEAEEGLARFRREAQAAGRLTHPNIVGVFDYGEHGDIAYIVMEYVDGPSVKSLLDRQERFALEHTMRIMTDLLNGLQFSHDRGVVHRDIKPANVMLTSEGQGKIADFGIARIESSSMTQAGTVLGTPAYMSPEQFMGQVVDARTDIYSSGVLLYQLLTGERPFEGGMSAIMHKALNTEPPAPSQISVTCSPLFDPIVRKAMAKRPEDRFQSAAEFLEALKAAASGQPMPGVITAVPADADSEATMVSTASRRPAAPPPSTTAPTPTTATTPRVPTEAAPAGRSAMPMIAGAIVAVLLLVGGGAWFFLFRGGPAPISVAQSTIPGTTTTPAGNDNPTASTGTGTTSLPAGNANASNSVTPPVSGPQSTGTPSTGTSTTGTPATGTASVGTAPATTPASTTVTPPSTTPPNTQVAMVGVDAIRRQVAQITASQRCAALEGNVKDGGSVTVTGIAGSTAANAVRSDLATAAAPDAVDWNVISVDPLFCPALDVVHPIAPGFAGTGPRLGLTLAGGKLTLRDGEQIRPQLRMPNFRANLRVDYVGHDGSVLHLYPQQADPANRMTADPSRSFDAGETVSLGDARPGHPAWEVGEPYGTDLIIAIASSAPLFTQPRPGNGEDAAPYLRDLQRAVNDAQQRGVQLVGSALRVVTEPKN